MEENKEIEKAPLAETDQLPNDEEEIAQKKLKRKKKRNLIFKILDVLIVAILIYFIVGYINFYKITNDKKPLFTINEKKYDVENGTVKVYHNGIYKIVEHEVTGVNKSYSLKLWFMDDIK